MKQLYKPIAFSPVARLTQSIGAGDVVIPVDNVAAFPDAPSLATIGVDDTAETILYTAKTENSLSGCTRGVEGDAKTWTEGESIGRNFTAKDHADIIANLQEFADHAANTENPHNVTAADVGAVPTTRTVNTKPLSDDVTLTAADVGAVPTTRTVNTKPLSDDVTLTAADVGAVPTTSGAQGQFLGFTATNTIGAVDAPKSKRAARFIVGTSTAGWTVADCDYLCDGIDDQVEINAAIQALPSSGGEVVILAGFYVISTKILINNNKVKLTGNGTSTQIHISGLVSDIGETIYIKGNNCKVSSFEFSGNSANTYGINNEGTGNTIAENFFTGYSKQPILSSGNSTRIINNTFTSGFNADCISIQGDDCVIEGNIFNRYLTGIYMYSSSANIIIANNIITNSTAGIHLTRANNVAIIGNICKGNKTGLAFATRNANITVTGNTFSENSEYGIKADYLSTSVISGNTCNDNKINIFIARTSEENTISGNICTFSDKNNLSGKQTIFTQGAYNLIVSNNCKGIEPFDGGSNNTLANNKY